MLYQLTLKKVDGSIKGYRVYVMRYIETETKKIILNERKTNRYNGFGPNGSKCR